MAKSTAKKPAAKKRATKKKVVKVVEKKESKGAYTAIIEVNETQHVAHGNTAFEAFSNFDIAPFMFKTKMYLKLQYKKKESSTMFLAIQFRRFQNNKTSREIWAKRLENSLA